MSDFSFSRCRKLLCSHDLEKKRKTVPSFKSSFHDWFNLAVEDNSEIQVKAKEAYSNISPLKDFCICTEILLKTADGDTLVLETWSLRMTTSDFFCDSPHISYTSLASVYSRMSLLLKSVIAVTRITPAYKLSSRQSADMYVILFRIYPGEPQVHQLGEHYLNNKIGEVLLPVGTIKMTVSYRSKDDMTITPQKVEKGSPFMMKSDYFKPDMSPQNLPLGGMKIDRNLNNCHNDARKIGAFASPSPLPENEMFEDLSLLEKTFLRSFPSRSLQEGSINEEELDISDNLNANETSNDENCNRNEKEKRKLASSSESDDFIMKPAFAICSADHDIGAFFKEFQSAPPLASFSGQPLAESLSDVTNQLVKYEEDMKDFDEFVNSVCNMVDKQI